MSESMMYYPIGKRVILESPYGGDDEWAVRRNVAYAEQALADSLRRGEAPIASHLLHTRVLDDKNREERKMGIGAGLAWGPVAQLWVFYNDLGMSSGMQNAEKLAHALKVEIEYRSLNLAPGWYVQDFSHVQI